MATKPTRQQQHACEQVAEALALLADAARREGSGLGPADFAQLTRLAARAVPVFDGDEFVARALARRCRTLGLPESTAELLALWEAGLPPLQILLLPDDALHALVARLEDEVGDV